MNYAQRKEEEERNLDDLEKSKRDIIYHLNRVAPENLKEIFKELLPFAKN